ncbi:MAG: hypothetical protein KAJ03_05140 [Gammaproteobacteria bacterium]|nr:hypothetical protein [Gammaproteobacteria bacterium]
MSAKGIVMTDQRLPNREETPVLDNVFRQLKEDTERQNKLREIDNKYYRLMLKAFSLMLVGFVALFTSMMYAQEYVAFVGGYVALCFITIVVINSLGALEGRKV